MSADGTNIELLLRKDRSDSISPRSLSLRSSHLLVTLYEVCKEWMGLIGYEHVATIGDSLMQFDAGGHELRRVKLPVEMTSRHAVESPSGTFIVSNSIKQLKENQYQNRISEVDVDGKMLRHFTGSRLLKLGFSHRIAVDSRGNVLLADTFNNHILLLDAQLTPRRIVIDKHQLNDRRPLRLCYVERTGQLLVILDNKSVSVFDMLSR